MAPKYYCGECDRIEDDPLFIDVERCSECGEYIEIAEEDDGQPSEQQEWADYDPEC